MCGKGSNPFHRLILPLKENGKYRMNNQYETIQITIYRFEADDVCTASVGSGEVDGDETKYPIPGGWAQ